MSQSRNNKSYTTSQIAEALFVVNKHAKTAPDPRELYTLKKEAIQQLLRKKQAKKIGLHFSNASKYSKQNSTLLVQVGDYYFHIPPKREDFQALQHLGEANQAYRNPKPSLSLSHAKRILQAYLGKNGQKPSNQNASRRSVPHSYQSSIYKPWGQLASWQDQPHYKKKR
ncbi:hypothetical protein N781_03550 [Pontibacillus halophilus JSM 076056 = DSM 19796]|uniref:YkyB-like protein n=1 Tax=Pontibacillus halophilus JSM 076056 = DSM 19796 TaxID=1385510 RepID=A0A0A5GK40_9BACI|nr:YkyB family protein [Pontibacillus halophilus]KGX91578.1 hypothetical protein N781_03550 [Pontibacillus halophilus JSM 076056 = DSM 19796]